MLRKSTIGPALTRYYLTPKWWDNWEGRPFSIKLHHITSDDTDWHNHPWNGLSIVFGRYWEAYEDMPRIFGKDPVYKLRKGWNWIESHRRHRVKLFRSRPVWTLFINFRKVNPGWSYGEAVKPWEGSDGERKEVKL